MERLLDSGRGVTTQSIESVKSLLAFMGQANNPLPEFVEMKAEDSRVVLVQSSKKDCYYVTTAKTCSCPAATFRQGSCKHQNRFFSKSTKQTMAKTLVQADQNLSEMPKSYQRLVMSTKEAASNEPGMSSGFKPVCPEGEPLSDFDRVS